jgi:hypothetical protein
MKTNIFRKINLPLFGRGLGGGLLLLIAAPALAQYNLTLCEGQGFMLTSDADGHPDLGLLTYRWKEGVPPQAPGTVTAVPTLTVTGNPAGTYAYVCEVANAACTLSSTSYTVQVVAAPVITLSGGANVQTVQLPCGTMTTVVYSAPGANFTLSDGGLPAGVTGTPSGASFTVAGTPSATGTYNYTVTAMVGSCTATASGAITVTELATPPGALTTNVWCIGTQTWSDRIAADPLNCTKVDIPSPNDAEEYTVYNGYYYYTWSCVMANTSTFCPDSDGWRLPTSDDFDGLESSIMPAELMGLWGAVGFAHHAAGLTGYDEVEGIWTSTTTPPHPLYIAYSSEVLSITDNGEDPLSLIVRCVR